MAGHFHNGMDLITATDIGRIHGVTDQMRLHRDWVIVPLGCAEQPVEIVMPDGKLLLRPPGGDRFEPWIDGLQARLSALDLSRIARLGVDDPVQHLTGTHAPRAHGTRRYVEGQADLMIGRSETP